MGTLIRFELKKMLRRRVALLANLAAIAAVCFMAFMAASQTTALGADGSQSRGTAAAAVLREGKEAHAGTLTPDRIASDVEAYRARAFASVDPSELDGLTSEEARGLMASRYGEAEVAAMEDDGYLMFLVSPWMEAGRESPFQALGRLTDADARDFYGQVERSARRQIDEGKGAWDLTEAERAFWERRAAEVPEPFTYGYAAGWACVADASAYLALAILAACVTLAPVFAGEYRSGADAVLLSCRNGRGRLVAAKLLASLLYVTALIAACCAVTVAIVGSVLGLDGFGVSYQTFWDVTSPTPLTVGQAALAALGLMYLAALGFAGLTLLLSSRTRSALAVMALDVALLLVVGSLPDGGDQLLSHLLALLPQGFSSAPYRLFMFSSYALGPVVVGMLGMVAGTYALLACASAPLAAASWSRHQVG